MVCSAAGADRKVKYFRGDRLNWDEKSRDGRAVRNECKPLEVSLIVSKALLILSLFTFSYIVVIWALFIYKACCVLA